MTTDTEKSLLSTASKMAMFENMPKPLAGENFRAYLGRYVNSQKLNREQRRAVRRVILAHFRNAGMDVNASAADCITAVNMHRYGVTQ